MDTRRNFFSFIGVGSAAAALDLPAPAKADVLKPGGIYVLSFDRRLSPSALGSLHELLSPIQEKTGCKFIVLPQGASISELGGSVEKTSALPDLPTIVDVSDTRLGAKTPRRAFLDGVELADCVRAELFSDGRGVAYVMQRNSDGDFIPTTNCHDVQIEVKVGKLEFREFRGAAKTETHGFSS